MKSLHLRGFGSLIISVEVKSRMSINNTGKSMMLMLEDDGIARAYDDTYDITIHCESAEERNRCIDILKKNRWIPADEPPETDDYILLSFENYSVPLVGRYEKDDKGGAYCVGDDEESCISQDMIVNAWQPLPEPYRDDGEI